MNISKSTSGIDVKKSLPRPGLLSLHRSLSADRRRNRAVQFSKGVNDLVLRVLRVLGVIGPRVYSCYMLLCCWILVDPARLDRTRRNRGSCHLWRTLCHRCGCTWYGLRATLGFASDSFATLFVKCIAAVCLHCGP